MGVGERMFPMPTLNCMWAMMVLLEHVEPILHTSQIMDLSFSKSVREHVYLPPRSIPLPPEEVPSPQRGGFEGECSLQKLVRMGFIEVNQLTPIVTPPPI